MNHLWAPWRSKYMQENREKQGCIFCDAAASPNDEQALVVYRGEFAFVMLNRFPYTSGHVMIAPYMHAARLAAVSEATTAEIMRLLRRGEEILERTYRADGLNLGMNLGEAAGAGIEKHIHMHLLPRWHGDANFMTVVGETRVLPESLEDTYRKLLDAFLHSA